jgi:hypothetical protein
MANTETTVVEEPTSAESAAPEATKPATPSLSIQDLIAVAQIIQLTSARGAYKAEELQSVGVLYNKLIAFLDSVGAITRTEETAAPEKQDD